MGGEKDIYTTGRQRDRPQEGEYRAIGRRVRAERQIGKRKANNWQREN